MSEAVTVVLGLGSNVEPEANLRRAVAALDQRLGLEAVSAVYASEAVGAPGSPPFLNAAVRFTSTLDPLTLRGEVLRPLEAELGRQRGADRNAPRTLDLDIVLYGDRVIADPAAGLYVPDPELATRAHVALPAADVLPDGVHPLTGERLADLARRLAAAAAIRLRADLDLGR